MNNHEERQIFSFDNIQVQNYDGPHNNYNPILQTYYTKFALDEDDLPSNVNEFDEISIGCHSIALLSPSNVTDPLPVGHEPNFGELESFNELIINAVRARPPLWNKLNVDFKNNEIRSRLWEEVTVETSYISRTSNISRIRKIWGNIKATYNKTKKRIANDTNGRIRKEYKYSKLLSFLDSNIEPISAIAERGIAGSCSEDIVVNVDESNSAHSEATSFPSGSKKRRTHSDQSVDVNRYLNITDNKTCASTSSNCTAIAVRDPIDLELDSFFGFMRPHMKSLDNLPRLEMQQEMLKLVSKSMQNKKN